MRATIQRSLLLCAVAAAIGGALVLIGHAAPTAATADVGCSREGPLLTPDQALPRACLSVGARRASLADLLGSPTLLKAANSQLKHPDLKARDVSVGAPAARLAPVTLPDGTVLAQLKVRASNASDALARLSALTGAALHANLQLRAASPSAASFVVGRMTTVGRRADNIRILLALLASLLIPAAAVYSLRLVGARSARFAAR